MNIPNISEFTLWNWIAIVAIVFSTISVVNAVLSLFGRFKTWKATQSKQLFDSQIKQYRERVRRFEEYDKLPSLFIADILSSVGKVIGLTLLMLVCEIVLLAFLRQFRLLDASDISLFIFVNVVLVGLLLSMLGISWAIIGEDYSDRKKFADKISKLVFKGKEKGYVENAIQLNAELLNLERDEVPIEAVPE